MPSVARIVFMGTPDFAVPALRALLESQTVVGVVTQPDKPAGRGNRLQPPPVKLVAESAGIPVYQPASLRKEEAAAPLRAWAPDLIVVAAFGQILRPHVLDLPALGCLNTHASLLPRWRGASPIQHAILAGDPESGVTLMKLEAGLDTGPMYVCEAVRLDPRETAATLHDKLSQLGADMLRRHLDDILAGRLLPVPQDDARATYAPMISKEAGRLDWSETAEALDRRVRAMTPWPGAFTTWGDEVLKIGSASPVPVLEAASPGTVMLAAGGPVVATGDGGLLLESLQLPGKRVLAAADFLRGRPDLIGARLGEAAAA
jgi:methionyl-tRNA formyltransferase